MFEGFSELQIWVLIGSAAVAGFYLGRWTGGTSAEARARGKRLAQEEAARDFVRLSDTDQSKVDQLVAAGKTIEAIKLVRKELNAGLYEARLVVDQRKRSIVPRRPGN